VERIWTFLTSTGWWRETKWTQRCVSRRPERQPAARYVINNRATITWQKWQQL